MLVAGDETAAGAGAKTEAAGAGSKTEAAGFGAKTAAAGVDAKTAAAGVGAKTAADVGAPAVPPDVEAPKEKAVLVLAGSFVAPIEPNTKPDFGGFPAMPANAEGAAVATASVGSGVLVRLFTNENTYIVTILGCEYRPDVGLLFLQGEMMRGVQRPPAYLVPGTWYQVPGRLFGEQTTRITLLGPHEVHIDNDNRIRSTV